MIKIVHLCLACFFPEGHSYQENLLPKFHKKLGYDVEVIASTIGFDEKGNLDYHREKTGSYVNKNNIKVTRLPFKYDNLLGYKLNCFVGTEKALNESSPDILFIHGCQFVDISIVVRYLKKHTNIKVFVDNHADFSNSAKNWKSRLFLHRIIWRFYANKINPFVRKWYGVLPARVDFLKKMYNLPSDKVEFLPMGADDEFVEKYSTQEVRDEYRKKYGIANDAFLIVTGGKIDHAKKQTLMLMDAVNQIDNPKLKLIVFGSVVDELKEFVNERCSKNVQYIGWQTSEQSYPHFAMADLVVFPGRHSVFWEQVAGMGIPMVVKYWPGTTHVNRGGNTQFLYEDSVEEMQNKIEEVLNGKIKEMNETAKKCCYFFCYSKIARRSILVD